MFENSLKLVEQCGLTHLHVFPFSPREGTPAARMPQLPRPIVKQRAARLREAGEAAHAAHLDQLVGTTQSVLVERDGIGRCEDFTLCRVEEGLPGEIVDTIIVEERGGQLFARALPNIEENRRNHG